ncbi:hypothetical protein E2C01_010719 [Portunus trituberculatus]|uniref:Uncharacterized protein n=1 Tax=Portunus trituberculatus TaxID=210409 RepID=A0A5B7D9E0_PORTR|nr:hypothetical protein [Portunus trituberculatus]
MHVTVYVTTYHRRDVTPATVSSLSNGASVVKVRVPRSAMRPHSGLLLHSDTAIEDLIWELLAGKSFLPGAPSRRGPRWLPLFALVDSAMK